MKKYLFTALLSLLASPAFAASSRVDHSGFVVWAFLGFCGIIVVSQVLPAALMFFGMIKAVTKEPTEYSTK